MHIPSSVWDWAAVLVGLHPSDGLFVPAYWSLPAALTAPFGWAPPPVAVLGLLLTASLAGVAVFAKRRQNGWLFFSCVIWGALLADTPHVVAVPLAVLLVRLLVRHLSRLILKERPVVHRLRWRRFLAAGTVAFLAVAFANFARNGVFYLSGYVRNALSALRWDGGWHPLDVMAMDGLLNEYAAELAREGAGKRWIFTDGLCDSGIELAAAQASSGLRAVSTTRGPYGAVQALRLGFTRREDQVALEQGASSLVRAWAVDRPAELTNAAYQCGFAFLEQEAAGRIGSCGLVLRDDSPVDGGREAADAATRRLGEGILEFYRRGGDPAHGGRVRQARFCAMQWRVSRAIRRQAAELDRLGRLEEAMAGTVLSEGLDGRNPLAKRQGPASEEMDMWAFGAVTPREGLALALRRANFVVARRFAEPILKDDPENPEANFALAMSHFKQREYAQARHYFLRALRSRPDDAALLNNIAVSSLELGDLEDAEEKANAALKLMPESAGIRDTVRKVGLERKKK